MKVAWLLAVFIAVVTYTPRLNLLRGRLCSELEILNWNWTNQMWANWHMSIKTVHVLGSSLSWQRKLMNSFMAPTKPDWSGLVLCQLKTYPITLNLLIYNHGTGPWSLTAVSGSVSSLLLAYSCSTWKLSVVSCTELKVHHREKLMTSLSQPRPQEVAHKATRWAGFPPGLAGVRL